MPWQKRSLEYVRIVPELNFASRFYPRMLKPLRLFPARRDAQDNRVEIKSGPPVELLNRIQDPGGGRTQILGNYGRLMFATGEGVLFGRDLSTARERWSFVWNDEIEVDSDSQGNVRKITHKLSGTETRDYAPEQAVLYRMWTPDPGRSYEAESPMLGVMEVAEELLILTKAVRATAVSRLVNGLLFLPSEISPPPEEAVGDEDPHNDPWSSEFIEHVVEQIENPGTAEALAPLISWVSGEHIDQIRFIPIHDPQNDYMEKDLRAEAITRLSYGLDMPPEALKGLGNTNHWAALQIIGDMWKSHGQALAQQFCDELSGVYLRPALEEIEYPDWDRVVIDYDPSKVLMKPDRSDEAKTAIAAGAIGFEGFRKMTNIPKDYEPSDEEWKKMLDLKAPNRNSQPQQQAPNPLNPRDQQAKGDPAQNGPPAPGPEGDSGRRTRVVTSSAASYEAMGAAMMSLARCRELAGIRLWQRQKSCPECFEKAEGIPHPLVAAALGPAVVTQVGQEPMRLVRGGTSMLQDMLEYWDYSPAQATAVCELIEQFAARTLYDERLPQLPSGFAAHLERARNGDASER